MRRCASAADFIPPSNPLDVTAQGLVDPGLYRRTLPPVLADERYGCVVLSIILSEAETAGLKIPPIIAALTEIHAESPCCSHAWTRARRSHKHISNSCEMPVHRISPPQNARSAPWRR
jgi:hypothetical protein